MGLVQFEDGKVLYYPYTPSTAAGYGFMACFAIVTCVHIVRVVQTKRRFFIPMILGGICMSCHAITNNATLTNCPLRRNIWILWPRLGRSATQLTQAIHVATHAHSRRASVCLRYHIRHTGTIKTSYPRST